MNETTLQVDVPGMDAMTIIKNARTMDSTAIQNSMTFIEAELEKKDPTLLQPLAAVTWQRDIVAVTGGGFMQYSSNFFVDYGNTARGKRHRGGDSQTNTPIIQAKLSKDTVPTMEYNMGVAIPLVQQEYLRGVGRSLDQIYDEGLRLDYNKWLDNIVYFGDTDLEQYGIVNNPKVATISPSTVDSHTTWRDKILNDKVDAVLADFDSVLSKVWAECQYDESGMPNHVGLPPALFSLLTTAKVSQAGNISVLKYIKENNIANSLGHALEIVPMRQLIGAGTGGKDRMIAYRNEKNRFHFDLTQPLMRIITGPDVANARIVSQYAAITTAPKLLYTETQAYMDGV